MNWDKIVTKKQQKKLLFSHKSVLKLKKKTKRKKQGGIHFYNIWCVKFTFETVLTEISQNVPPFHMFALLL